MIVAARCPATIVPSPPAPGHVEAPRPRPGGRPRSAGGTGPAPPAALAEGRLTQPAFAELMARSGGEGGFRPTLSPERLGRFMSDEGFGDIEMEPIDRLGGGFTYRVEARVD